MYGWHYWADAGDALVASRRALGAQFRNAHAFSYEGTEAVVDSAWATARVAPRVPGMGMN